MIASENPNKKFNETPDQKAQRAVKIITILKKSTEHMPPPAGQEIIERFGRDPFLILVSCILSLRTKDTVSLPASLRLFEEITTPKELVQLPLPRMQALIYPVGFYRQKSRQLHILSRQLLEQFDGNVPSGEAELLSLTGVGRKTMNLVRGYGFNIPALCVDTHVHRISNRLGLVATQTPEGTENALKAFLPEQYWTEYNHLLVMWGQNICVPISPKCSQCAIVNLCPKIGVTKQR